MHHVRCKRKRNNGQYAMICSLLAIWIPGEHLARLFRKEVKGKVYPYSYA